MSIFDAIKKSVLEGFSSEITLPDIIISLIVAFLAGLFILVIYRLTLRGVSRNRTFEVTLLLITPISAMIVLTITSNLALSLGMVGALSIIRFRTAIKDASDTAFMFWSVAAGITAGAHFYKITIIGCLFIGLASFLVLKLSSVGARPYLLVVRSDSDKAVDYTARLLNENNIKNRLSSLVNNGEYTEVIYEIALGGKQQKLVSALSNLPDVKSVSLVDCRN
ncbi:MAG: DUF4956 domain-containing protein [Clostridia bacterium]|nr:DUF4956 domain-containing protein [Clostridia bacterium]MBR6784021.1 DUF4956 domain-containing protein [Clostridia bacterium]